MEIKRGYKEGEMVPIRDGFGEGLITAGQANSKVLALTADLLESVRMHKFAQKFPERFWNVGISEQNMAAVAAGLALEGFVPYIGSFANFQPGRNFDQIRTSICMMNANVKIVSSHAGFSYGEDGITVQMLEDVAMMRALPNMQVWIPADAQQAALMAVAAAREEGPAYLRLGRAATPILPQPTNVSLKGKFEIGKAQELREGNDLTIIANGYMVDLALKAAKQLAPQGIDARVINIHTVKPLDKEAILKAAEETSGFVVCEEAQVSGGLGSAVAETIAGSKFRSPIKFVAVHDQFGESGTQEELMQSRGLTFENIIAMAKSLRV